MALAVIKGISCWIIYFFCSRIWPGRNNSSQTMLAAECFINFVHSGESPSSIHHAAVLVQHRERQEHPIPLPWLNFQTPQQLPNLPAAQRGRPQGEGFIHRFSSIWQRGKLQTLAAPRQLRVRLGTLPGSDLPRKLFLPRSKAHSEEDRAPEVYSSSLFLRSQSDLLTMEMSCRLMMLACTTGWVCRGSLSFKAKIWPWKPEKCQCFKKKVDMRYKSTLEYTYNPSDKVHPGAAVNGLNKIYKDRRCTSRSPWIELLRVSDNNHSFVKSMTNNSFEHGFMKI